jgi:hypothetical protein
MSTTVTGYVYSQVNGEPIEGAIVFAGTTISAETDASGQYSLSGVPAGDVCITAINPTSLFSSMSVVTSASSVDFWLLPSAANYYYVNLTVVVSDESGNPVSGAAIYAQTLGCGGGTLYGSTDAYGRLTGRSRVPEGYTDELDIYASKAGVGGGYTKNVVATISGATAEVHITFGTPATASGNFVDSTGSCTMFAVAPIVCSDYGYSGFSDLTETLSSNTYSGLLVPCANSGSDTIGMVAAGMCSAVGGWSGGAYHFVRVSPTAGGSLSQNFEFNAPIENVTYSTAESGGIVTITMSWDAPSGWSPSYYIASYFGSTVFLTGTSVSFPMLSSMYHYVDGGSCFIGGVESTSTFDWNNVDLSNMYLDKGTFMGKTVLGY